MKSLIESGKDITIYGGGFLGSELSVALKQASAKYGNSIHQVIPEEGNMSLVFPSFLSKWITQKLRDYGVIIHQQSKIDSISLGDNKLLLNLNTGQKISTDHLILAAGILPNVELAFKSGLEIDEIHGGIVTNAELEARRDVFAAGDVISFYDVTLGRRRVEHHDHAVLSGITAGTNMTGKRKLFKHQSMYWMDLGPSISFEAVGLTDSTLSTVSVWTKNDESGNSIPVDGSNIDFNKGLIFYLKDLKIVGMVMFNIPSKVNVAKNILMSGKTSQDINHLIEKFELYS